MAAARAEWHGGDSSGARAGAEGSATLFKNWREHGLGTVEGEAGGGLRRWVTALASGKMVVAVVAGYGGTLTKWRG